MNSIDLDTIRHSSAHLMAQAIQRLWPNTSVQFGVGPVIETGFYYDVDMDYRLGEEDLRKIEKKMKEIIREKLAIERQVMQRQEAIDFFSSHGQTLKVELIEAIPSDEEISCYKQGEFIDLCRGPHVENTGQLPTSFKLLNVAGAYWRGDEKRSMLQRVYAASFLSREELKQHLHFLQEAKARDHRKLGKELALFHFEAVAPASPFFMPKGAVVYNQLIEFMRRIYRWYGYQEVITPQVLDSDLWHTSGHYEHYKENMYFSQIDQREYAVKPMNCPCHMLMFKHYKHSYRSLPLRYADFGRLHRYEKHGAISGLTRVRTFCQDDAHVFIALDGIQEEIKKLMEMFFICYEHFGFQKIRINLSTRPDPKIGDDATWDQAEQALTGALESAGHEYFVKEGEGAFYGPKIDVEIADALNRYHQLGTIQLDFQLPERFDLHYTDSHSNEVRPVVIHRALLGSLERFMGIYIEHVAGAFPFWLAPEQAVIVPIKKEAHGDFCHNLHAELEQRRFRISLDERPESMGYKTRQIQKAKIPFMIVVGDREVENEQVSIRAYGEKHNQTLSLSELIDKFTELQTKEIPAKLRPSR